MIRKSNKERILALFFDSPAKHFQLREISRLTNIGLPSAKRYAETLAKEGLVKKEKGNIFPFFTANRESREFRLLKVAYLLLALEESGLITQLESTYPDCIILFGSGARGEDNEKSDIDIFVQGEEQKPDTGNLEKKLKRKTNILFEPKIDALQKELVNNLANGIVLRGYLKVV